MELPKDWDEISNAAYNEWNDGNVYAKQAIRSAVERCFVLHSKPKKELTAEDKYNIWLSCYDSQFQSAICKDGSEVVDRIIAAYEAKQREPETVTFRAARRCSDSKVDLLDASISLPDHWEWLDLDGKPQTFEVVLP